MLKMAADINVEEFSQNPDWETFDSLQKPNLLKLAQHLELDVTTKTRKFAIKNKLIDYFVQDDLWDESFLQYKANLNSDDSNIQLQLKQMEMKMKFDMELEQKTLEKEEKEKQMQMQIEKEKLDTKLKFELELEKAKLEKQVELAKLDKENQGDNKSSSTSDKFNPSKCSHLVPEFDESNVDQFFAHFEKIALSMKWPKDQWVAIIQKSFKGKASNTYVDLPIEVVSNYDTVKKSILQAYEFVPEYYRVQFRSSRKEDSMSHIEFARQKEHTFDRWLHSRKVESFEGLRELVLLEEFKNKVHPVIKDYLNESEITSFRQAATKADEYYVTHKYKFANKSKNVNKSKFRSDYNPPRDANTSNQSDHVNGKPFKSDKGKSPPSPTSGSDQNQVVCKYCKIPGHTVSTCRRLLEKKQKQEQLQVQALLLLFWTPRLRQLVSPTCPVHCPKQKLGI